MSNKKHPTHPVKVAGVKGDQSVKLKPSFEWARESDSHSQQFCKYLPNESTTLTSFNFGLHKKEDDQEYFETRQTLEFNALWAKNTTNDKIKAINPSLAEALKNVHFYNGEILELEK